MVDFSDNFKTFTGGTVSNEQLSKMSLLEIRSLREAYPTTGDSKYNQEMQNRLGAYDHRSFLREWISEEGSVTGTVRAAAGLVGIPAYAASKTLGISHGRSEPTIEETKQSLIGVGEGLKALFLPEEKKATEIPKTNYPIVDKKKTEELSLMKTVEDLLPNLIKTESGGKHTDKEGNLLVGVTGDLGITQVRPQTAQDPGYGITPIQNDSQEEYIRFTKDYLTKMIQIFGSVEHGVAAYNAGPGSIHRAVSKAQRTGKDWKEFIPKTTKEYLKKVSVDNGTATV